MAKARIIQERDDLAMLNDQNSWPHWPFMPMKRRRAEGGFPEMGVLVATLPLSFYKDMNLFAANLAEVVTGSEGQEVTITEILAEGWVVD